MAQDRGDEARRPEIRRREVGHRAFATRRAPLVRVPSPTRGRVQAHLHRVPARTLPQVADGARVTPRPPRRDPAEAFAADAFAEVLDHRADPYATCERPRDGVVAPPRAEYRVDGARGTHGGADVVDVPLGSIRIFRIRIRRRGRHVAGDQHGSPRRRDPLLVPRLDRLAQPHDAVAPFAVARGDVPRFQGHEHTGNDPRALRRDADREPGDETTRGAIPRR
mmetsp:Transcript_8725/g.35724  ORF Transcript_8725/g.35724 Transcript_8725/m.35724 type:complete len:222 (-) Transcript_8725:943-1608(-)